LKKCSNSTLLNKTNCLSDKEIEEKLSQALIAILFIDIQINSESYETPLFTYLNMKLLPLTTSIFKNYIMEISKISYFSDNNLFISSLEETKGYKVSKIIERVDIRGSNNLSKDIFNQFTFTMSDETKIVTRLYEKISNKIAEIGGLAHALIILGKGILYFWSNNNILLYLISRIIPYSEVNNFFNEKFDNDPFKDIKRKKTILFDQNKQFKKSPRSSINNICNNIDRKNSPKINNNNNNNNNNDISKDSLLLINQKKREMIFNNNNNINNNYINYERNSKFNSNLIPITEIINNNNNLNQEENIDINNNNKFNINDNRINNNNNNKA